MAAPFRIEALGAGHDRTGFRSGTEPLDRYLNTQAGQDVRRRLSACCVAVDVASGRLAGYYTLAAGGVPITDLPPALARRLPRYPSVPVARLGRLAVDQAFRGQGLSGALLADAAVRAARAEVAVFALVVAAKDDAAVAFCQHHGFAPLAQPVRSLVLVLQGLRGD